MTKLEELMQCNLFYKDNGDFDYEQHIAKPRKLYAEARYEMELWLEGTLTSEIIEEGCSGASATIYLPKADIKIKVLGSGSICPEKFRLPIGYIDAFTYEEIVKDNPIKKFLDFIYKVCRQWEPVLAQLTQKSRYPLITEELLWNTRYCDPIGICRIFPLMRNYEECMKGLYL